MSIEALREQLDYLILIAATDADGYVGAETVAQREKIIASLSAQPVAWRPIESAPKDGTLILGYADGAMATVEWYELGGYWSLRVCGGYAEDSEWEPVLWQPITPPTQEPKP